MSGAKFVGLLLMWLVAPWPAALAAEMAVQACFSPQGKCSAHILREIEGAQKELLIAVYALTHEDLAQAIVKAQRRGVVVQIVIDRDFDLSNERSKGKYFEMQNVPLRRVSGVRARTAERDGGLMHQKFAVIDRRVVLTGSYNWTYSADRLNDENLLVFRDAGPLAEEYRKVFFSLWGRKP